MLRFLTVVFAIWFAIALFPERPAVHAASYAKEKVFLSRTCSDSRWTIDESDDQSVTVVCYALPEDEASR